MDSTPKAKRGRRTRYEPVYLPLWVSDVMTHLQITGESTEAFGARVRLWCVSTNLSPPGMLPDDDEQLAKWAGLSLERWQALKATVTSSWEYDAKRKRFVLRRVRAEMKRRKLISNSKREAAEARWRGDKGKSDRELYAGASPDASMCSATLQVPITRTQTSAREGEKTPPAPPTPTPPIPRSRSRPSRSQRQPTATAPPAVQVYASVVGEWPVCALWAAVDAQIGRDLERLRHWELFVTWWCGEGYNAGNLNGMLDRWRIETEEPKSIEGSGGNGDQAPLQPPIPTAPIDPSSLERLRTVVGGVAQSLRVEGSVSPGGTH